MHWCGQYWTPAFPSAYFLHLAYPMSLPAPSFGSWSTTMDIPSCTTWTTSSCLVCLDCPPVRTLCPQCCMSARSWACQSSWRNLKGQPLASLCLVLCWTPVYSYYGYLWPNCKKSPASPNAGRLRGKRSATMRELLSLISKLSFTSKVVPAGRLFLGHLIHLPTTAKRLHHRIHINMDARDVLLLHGHHGTALPCSLPLNGKMLRTSTSTLMYLVHWGLGHSSIEPGSGGGGGLAATPATTRTLNTVVRAVHHSGSSPHLGTPLIWVMHVISLR